MPTAVGVERLDIGVEGMSCAACAARIERKLGALDGVVEAGVNYATATATIVADPTLVTLDVVRDTVNRLGYGVRAPELPDDAAYARGLVRRLLVAVACTLPLLALSMVSPLQFRGWEWLALVLATPVVWWSGWRFHRNAAVNLRHGTTTMDTLISLGTVTAYGWSAVALVALDAGAHVYFEVAAVIVTLVLVGRLLEARSRARAGRSIRALLELGAKHARLVDGREVPVAELQPGDRFTVRPGERVATDGRVVEGRSALDASMFSGEPLPVDVVVGDAVTGGSVNTTGYLVVEATRVGADTALAQIVRLVQRAQGTKAPVQRLADRIAAVFVPTVLLIALGTLAVWLLSGAAVTDAVTAAVAVLIIACPCALGLATPTAVMVGTGRGSELGILISGGDVLEATRRIDTVVLDKTGTLTEGAMRLVDVQVVGGDDGLLARVAVAEAASEHPVAAAIAAGLRERGVSAVVAADAFENQPGAGVSASVAGREVIVGRRELFTLVPDELEAVAATYEGQGATAVFAGDRAAASAVLVVADTIRPTAAAAVRQLRDLGLTPILVTGDQPAAAHAVAAAVGVADVRAGARPGDKAAVVRALQDQGQRVAVVGDGVNDAPALAQADLGIAMGSGTDVAIEASDITILGHDLRAVGDAVLLARRTLRTIHVNLFWAFAYNVAAIPLAALGLLSPVIAAAAMSLSSVFVVTNSLRLRRFTGAARGRE